MYIMISVNLAGHGSNSNSGGLFLLNMKPTFLKTFPDDNLKPDLVTVILSQGDTNAVKSESVCLLFDSVSLNLHDHYMYNGQDFVQNVFVTLVCIL